MHHIEEKNNEKVVILLLRATKIQDADWIG